MQLKPVNEEHIDFQNSWLVKHLFNNNSCELTKVHKMSYRDSNVIYKT